MKRMRAVSALLDQEHSDAESAPAMFAGRLIVGALATRILIVSDCPDRSCDASRQLESQLKLLQAEYTVSDPVLMADDAAAHAPALTSAQGGTP
jgi:hypothetical protein